jgi:hypothetical protein
MSQKAAVRFNLIACCALVKKGLFVFLSGLFIILKVLVKF